MGGMVRLDRWRLASPLPNHQVDELSLFDCSKPLGAPPRKTTAIGGLFLILSMA